MSRNAKTSVAPARAAHAAGVRPNAVRRFTTAARTPRRSASFTSSFTARNAPRELATCSGSAPSSSVGEAKTHPARHRSATQLAPPRSARAAAQWHGAAPEPSRASSASGQSANKTRALAALPARHATCKAVLPAFVRLRASALAPTRRTSMLCVIAFAFAFASERSFETTLASRSAAAARSDSSTATTPVSAATCSAVAPASSAAATSVLSSFVSRSTSSRCPPRAAKCRHVHPPQPRK